MSCNPKWHCQAGVPCFESDRLRLALDPERGLVGVRFSPANLEWPQLLGVEIVDAAGLGPHRLSEPGALPEIVVRQDAVLAMYKPTAARPVECYARWRVHEQGVFDLEVSALTPGQWHGLSVQTRSLLPAGSSQVLAQYPYLVLSHPQAAPSLSYVEMCHPNDGIGVDLADKNNVRFRLFGHDLEKGVILRGRLRGMIVPREDDVQIARKAYAGFLRELPHLSAY
jgi:hypothetical protein